MDIKLLVMDVDGTLTDGKIYMGANGEVMKAFDVKDGYAIVNMLPEHRVVPVIITGRRSEIVENRASELGIKELHQGVQDKLPKLIEIAAKYNVNQSAIAYIGDDLTDLTCIKLCGMSACPRDAVDEVKQRVNYVCEHDGGHGAVREFVEYILNN